MNATALHENLSTYDTAVAADPTRATTALAAVRRQRAAIKPSLDELVQSVRAAGRQPGMDAGRIQAMVNELQLAHSLWPDGDGEAAALAQDGVVLCEHLKQSALRSAQLTVADRLTAELIEIKPGQFIDLKEFLSGEVPTEALAELAVWLDRHGNLLENGVVDVRRACVYRLPKSISGRAWRYPGAPIASLLASAAVLAVAAWLAHKAGDGSRSRLGPWLYAYAAVLVGVAIHFGVAVSKRRATTATGDTPEVATEVPVLSKWWQWLMLRPLAVPSLLLAPLITVITLRLLDYPVHIDKPKELLTYMLAGFGADSIAGAASKRINDLAGVVQKDITRKIS